MVDERPVRTKELSIPLGEGRWLVGRGVEASNVVNVPTCNTNFGLFVTKVLNVIRNWS